MIKRFFKYQTRKQYSDDTARPAHNVSYIVETGEVIYGRLHAVDRSINPVIMDICVSQGWAQESNDYLTFEEAASVTDIGTIFKNCAADNFDEFQHFKNVNYLVGGAFQNSSFKSITFPSSVKGYTGNPKSNTLANCSHLNKIDLSQCKLSALTENFAYKSNVRRVILPSTCNNISVNSLNRGLYYIIMPYNGLVTVGTGNSLGFNIYVPDNLVNTYKTDTTSTKYMGSSWSTVASRIKPISQFEIDMASPAIEFEYESVKNKVLALADYRGDGVVTEHSALSYTDLETDFKNIANYKFNEFRYFKNITYTRNGALQTSIREITFHNNFTSLGGTTFYGASLTKITLPESLTSIGGSCFTYARNMAYIKCLAVTPPTYGTNAFAQSGSCNIYVPDDSVNAYKTASGWTAVASRIKALSTWDADAAANNWT